MKNIYSVGQVNRYIKNMFSQDYFLGNVSIRGEVSNLKYHSSGHVYFTLKDSQSQISCVLFSAYRKELNFRIESGMQIIVSGSVEVYERDGKFQIYAKGITLDGAGQLYEMFEKRKKELEEQGLFSEIYKKQIPSYADRIGVITAPTGAAVQDIIQIAKRRNPYVEIILFPAIVQGDKAVSSLVTGLRTLDRLGLDIIIIGRGGGSIEDLWAFNEIEVVQAIFDANTPIISAVGHETDTTLCDYVSDLRAPTPSAAAELAVYEFLKLENQLKQYRELLLRIIQQKIGFERNRTLQIQTRLKILHPQNQIKEKRMYLLAMERRMVMLEQKIVDKKKYQLAIYIEKFKGLSPLIKISKGFGYITNEAGESLISVDQTKKGERLTIQLRDGKIGATVSDKLKEELIIEEIMIEE